MGESTSLLGVVESVLDAIGTRELSEARAAENSFDGSEPDDSGTCFCNRTQREPSVWTMSLSSRPLAFDSRAGLRFLP